MIGDALARATHRCQATEVAFAANALNRMLNSDARAILYRLKPDDGWGQCVHLADPLQQGSASAVAG
jgi:hypothetical protein